MEPFNCAILCAAAVQSLLAEHFHYKTTKGILYRELPRVYSDWEFLESNKSDNWQWNLWFCLQRYLETTIGAGIGFVGQQRLGLNYDLPQQSRVPRTPVTLPYYSTISLL